MRRNMGSISYQHTPLYKISVLKPFSSKPKCGY
jgi:hypothetical protein